MDKVSLEDVINQNELPLISYLECPIDNMISLNPLMCKKCETVFCPDCIENWKKKSNVCPMRCNPMDLVSIEKNILKSQINKIKLACPFQNFGCLTQVPVNEVSRHEKMCEYRGAKCEKCFETVPLTLINSHLYDSCSKNKIACFICNNNFTLKDLPSHLEGCRVISLVCKICIQIIDSDSNTHNMECPLRITNCTLCKVPELNIEIKNGQHKCITDSVIGSNLNTYLKSIHGKYEGHVNGIIVKQDEKFRDFNKKLSDLSGEIYRRENDKSHALDSKVAKVSEEIAKRMASIKRDKFEYIKKIKAEIIDWRGFVDSKNEEVVSLIDLYEKNKNLLKREYELKIISKSKNLDYLRNLLLYGGPQANNHEHNNANPGISSINLVRASLSCKICSVEVMDANNNRCGNCNTALCRNCSKQCPNKIYDHPNNNFCNDCFVMCLLCIEVKQCKSCTKKCFFKGCNNNLCFSCFDKNKHQLRPENTNCKFYKCDSCQTDANCIMTTVYCASCDRRVCKNCFHKDHKIHVNSK